MGGSQVIVGPGTKFVKAGDSTAALPGGAGGSTLPPLMTDVLAAQAAEAALTPGTADDIVAADAAVKWWEGRLGAARSQRDYAGIATAAGNLKSARDFRAGLGATVADNTNAIKELTDQLKAHDQMVERVATQQPNAIIAGLLDDHRRGDRRPCRPRV